MDCLVMPFSRGVRFEALNEPLAGGHGAFEGAVVDSPNVLAVYDVIKRFFFMPKNINLLTLACIDGQSFSGSARI